MRPLGATTDEGATTFVVTSGVAERIELCLFGLDGDETDRIDLTPDGEGDWSVRQVGVGAGQRYGFRVHGPGDPANGHACDPAKLLLDPAARRVVGGVTWRPELTAPGVDSAPLVPRGVVVDAFDPIDPSERPDIAWEDTLVYEAHVEHMTARHGLVPADDRGRYLGLVAPAVIDHLQRLGVTAVELLPVQQFVSEQNLVVEGSRNVWGYNPIAWGAPHNAYATPGENPVGELRRAVRGLHDAGMEVWLDVVFNHTCEGSLGSGPILSWRGFDNASTYRLRSEGGQLRDDDVTGCGNAVDTRSPQVRRLIRQCLVRWAREFGIDGFRFDLGATLVRGDDGPSAVSEFLAELRAEPDLAGVKLVAEPWDTGPGGYALGIFPAPWREWNDQFRDGARDLWRSRSGRPQAARLLTGSAGFFQHDDRPASSSVNAVTTHDGFTLNDLVAFDHPVDGAHEQRSWNGGLEGPTSDPAVERGRQRRQRAMLAMMLVSQGIPMITAGDELGRTQGGVANGYTLDPDQWGLPWPEADWDLASWLAAAVAWRRDHPLVRRGEWADPTNTSLRWLEPSGEDVDEAGWADGERRALAVVLAAPTPEVVLLLNFGSTAVAFELPDGRWEVGIDTGATRGDLGPGPVVSGRLDVEGPGLKALSRVAGT